MRSFPADWALTTLGKIAEVKWGDTSKTKSSYTEEGFVAYSASGPDGFLPYYDFLGDGVVISAIDAKCGITWLARGSWSCIKNTIYFRSTSPEADTRFLYWATKDPNTWPKRGAAQPFISQEDARNVQVVLPPISTQRKIAAILSAYDDLIENNARRIAILEEMARALYREWFVDFRFPGHERVGLVESEVGLIPEGWEVKSIGEAIETLGGGTPSTKKLDCWEGGDVVWYSPTDVTTAGSMFVFDSAKHITEAGLRESSARLFPAYSVMLTSRATIGVTAINTQPACTNQGFITCVPNERMSSYQIYYWLQENKGKIISLASGATFKEISRGTFRQLPVVLPDPETACRFNQVITPLGEQIENSLARNSILRQTRDLLLPKLISGEIISHGNLEPDASP